MDLMEALKEAKEFTRTLSSPELFLVFMAELLADGVQVCTVKYFINSTVYLKYLVRKYSTGPLLIVRNTLVIVRKPGSDFRRQQESVEPQSRVPH